MQSKVLHTVSRSDYSYLQLAVAAFLGTPMAAAFLVGRNISNRRGAAWGWAYFVVFCVAFISVAALNPVSNRALDVVLFSIFVIVILGSNFLLGDSHGDTNQGWLKVIGISLCFLASWLAIIMVVFG
jgi:hypothetical protein